MTRQQEDDTSYMRNKWRCSACGSINSMDFDNYCRKCMDKALAEDEAKLSALTSPNRDQDAALSPHQRGQQ